MQGIKTFFAFIKPYRATLLLATLGMGVFTLLKSGEPLLFRFLVDRVLVQQRWELVAPLLTLQLVMLVAAAALRFVNVRTLLVVSRKCIGDIRIALFDKIIALDRAFVTRCRAGTLSGHLMDDVNRLQRLINNNTLQVVVDVIVFVAAQVVALSISFQLWLVVAAMLLSYTVLFRIFGARITRNTRLARKQYDALTGRLQETLTHAEHVRHNHAQNREELSFLATLKQTLVHEFRSGMFTVSLDSSCTTIAALGSTAVLCCGAFMVLQNRLTVGSLLAFNSYVWMSIHPVLRLTALVGQLQATRVSLERVMQLLNRPATIDEQRSGKRMPRPRGRVCFEKVSFRYEPQLPLFDKLDFCVEPGMMVALVGPTGCGKTTLTSLLMRYYAVEQGRICIDSHNIADVNVRSLRRNFGVVNQSPLLFEQSIAENIAYGAAHATLAQIRSAASIAQINSFIHTLADGYESIVGSRGVRLSLGQQQRLCIARALVSDPPLLIFDEATAALDSESEAAIQKALATLQGSRTMFVIAHRLSTIVDADMILVLDKGHLIEQGTHRELLESSGMYAGLFAQLSGRMSYAVDG